MSSAAEAVGAPAKHKNKKSRRLSTLPHSLPCSTIDAKELDFRVRDGIGYGLFAIITGKIEKAILKYIVSVLNYGF